MSVDWYVPSHDGSLVACGVAAGGDEQSDVRVLDVESGSVVEELPECGRTNPLMFAWTDDGFYYVRTGAIDDADDSGGDGNGDGDSDGDGEGQLSKELCYHDLETDPADDRVLKADFDPQTWPTVSTDVDGEYVVLAESIGWERTDLYYAPIGGEEFDPLVVGEDAIFEPYLRGNDCYVNTSREGSNYRLERISLDDRPVDDLSLGRDGFETIVPERDEAILEGIAFAGDALVAKYLRDATHELVEYDLDGERRGDVSLPGTGTVTVMNGSREREELFVVYESFEEPPSVRRYEPGTGGTDAVDQPAVRVDADLDVTQEWFESKDGTDVPAFVVARSDRRHDGDTPTVLYGYGGFDISLTPFFPDFAVPFPEAGGAFAVANLRGGGEFGEAWHRAGRHEDRQNVFDDFFAVADGLIERGYASRNRLACYGGLLVVVAVTQRSDLFEAAVCKVPLLDMLRFHTSLLGRSWTTEYGSPDDPEAYEYLRAYSPYHNVEKGPYPAVLLATGDGDSRVDPFHARKMTTELQARNTSDEPVLLKTYTDTGHGVGKPVSRVIEERLNDWCFLADRLDLYRERS